MHNKKAFSLIELLTALLVLGVLAAAILPAITRVMPNQNKLLIKMAYYSTTNMVKDLIDNGYFYSRFNEENADSSYLGFDDLKEITYKGEKYSGNTKFVELFLLGLKYNGSPSTSTSSCTFSSFKPSSSATAVSPTISKCSTVKTSDGMSWSIGVPSTVGTAGWNTDPSKPVAYILVDVNADKAPNCYQGNSSNACKNRTNNFDQIRMSVAIDGSVKLDANGAWAKDTVKIGSSINGDD